MRSRSARVVARVLPLLWVLAGAACATPQGPLYRWGSYEDSIEELYRDARGESQIEAQIERLSEEIARADDRGDKVPPGLHAHLGYLHTLAGRVDEAVAHFLIEKREFPESAKFIDGLLERMKR